MRNSNEGIVVESRDRAAAAKTAATVGRSVEEKKGRQMGGVVSVEMGVADVCFRWSQMGKRRSIVDRWISRKLR